MAASLDHRLLRGELVDRFDTLEDTVKRLAIFGWWLAIGIWAVIFAIAAEAAWRLRNILSQ